MPPTFQKKKKIIGWRNLHEILTWTNVNLIKTVIQEKRGREWKVNEFLLKSDKNLEN